MAYSTNLKSLLVIGTSALTVMAGASVATAQSTEAEAGTHAVTQAQLNIEAQGEGTTQEIADRVAAALAEQGYRVTKAKKTLLGRLQIIAESAEARREVVVSSTTGAVMRDTIIEVFADSDSDGSDASASASGKADASIGVDIGSEGSSETSVSTTASGSATASAEGGATEDTAGSEDGGSAEAKGSVSGSAGSSIGAAADGATAEGDVSGSADADVSGNLGQ